jgi:hypothetical protein
MTVNSPVLPEWETRFPDLGPHWTHWRLDGDGVMFALVPGDQLGRALRLVAENCERFSRIRAYRARADANGDCAAFENFFFSISNRTNSTLEIDRGGQGA